MDRVDRHDVGVLQLGERPRFAETVGGRVFITTEAVGQLALAGQIDAAEGAPAQLGEQAEADDSASTRGIRRDGSGQLLGDDRDPSGAARRRPRRDPRRPFEAFRGRPDGLTARARLISAPVSIGLGRFRRRHGMESGSVSCEHGPAALRHSPAYRQGTPGAGVASSSRPHRTDADTPPAWVALQPRDASDIPRR